MISARILTINITNGILISSVWYNKDIGGMGDPHQHREENGIQIGIKPSTKYPW